MQTVRFMKKENLEAHQRILKGYFEEIIQMYGVDLDYFRRDYDFFDPDAYLQEDVNGDFTYGEDTSSEFSLKVPMIGFMEMGGDSQILGMLGMEAAADAQVFLSKETFEAKLVEHVGKMTTGFFEVPVAAEITEWAGVYSGTLEDEEFDITVDGVIGPLDEGAIDESITPDNMEFTKPINRDLKDVRYYEENRIVQGTLSGNLTGTIDAEGNGTLSGTVSGVLTYNSPPGEKTAPNWGIAPQVGDFFRLEFSDENHEEYEITQVTDRNLGIDGISPLLGKYVWKCDVVRRDPSHEETVDDRDEEEFIPELNEIFTAAQEAESDRIHDYDDGSDDVYGGF